MDDALQERREARNHAAARASSTKEFRLVFQPLLNLKTGRVCAVEALLRWDHPERGSIPPNEFIPDCRGIRAHRRDRRVGAERGLRRRGALARRHPRRGEPFDRAVPQPQSARPREIGARDLGARSGAARAGGDRIAPPRRQRHDPRRAARIAPPRRPHLDGRFRHRLLFAELPALLPLRQDQDRPVVREGHFGRRREPRHRQRRHRARQKPRHGDHRRRHRNRGAARTGALAGLHRGAGLSFQPAAARQRHRHACCRRSRDRGMGQNGQ